MPSDLDELAPMLFHETVAQGPQVPAELPDDRAILDRISDGVAVLLVGPAGEQYETDAASLPDDATEGSVLNVTLFPELVVGPVDHDLTRTRTLAASSRLRRIREERDSRRFRRS